jgi:tetratricopeptide (TPR) repeat protein
MIRWLLQLVGLRRRRRRFYVQPPLPPPAQLRRRYKGETAMPLPPGYIQARGQAEPSPPPPLPVRRFGPASMPMPPGQLQGPTQPAGERARESGKEAKASPSELVRALEQPSQTVRRRRAAPSPQTPAALPAANPREPRFRPWMARKWAIWRPRLGRAGRFGVFYLAPAAVVVVVAGLVLREMRNVGIVVMPFSVPAALAQTGLSADVLAQHLADRVLLVRRVTLADRSNRPDDSLSGPVPAIGLPAPLLSRRGIATRLRDIFATPVERVSGDVVTQPDGKLTLRLHMTGAGEIAVQDGLTPGDMDASLEHVAGQVWRVVDPTLYAWYVSEVEPRPAVVLSALRSLLKDQVTGQELSDPVARHTVMMLIADALQRSGDARGALDQIAAMGTVANLYAPAWAVRASALLQLGRAEEATEAQERVLVLSPDSAWAHKSSARFFLTIGRLDDAYQQARAAVRIAPDDGAAGILESAALVVLHREKEAVEVARQTIQRAPAQPGVQEAFGNALLAVHRPDLALPMYDSELRLHPGRVGAMIGRVRALQALHRNDEALVTADAALKIMPNNGTTMMLRGWSLLALKRPQDALGVFDLLLNSRADLPVLLQGKTKALVALGRNADAIATLERLDKVIPGNAEVETELKRLREAPK